MERTTKVTGETRDLIEAIAIEHLGIETLETLASQRVNVALATGRAAARRANAGVVRAEIYTAVMDERTCRGGELRCWEQDGAEYAVGEGVPCPNPHCLGADRCRCVRVGVVGGGEAVTSAQRARMPEIEQPESVSFCV